MSEKKEEKVMKKSLMEADQRWEIADMFLKILAEKQLTARESLSVLHNAQMKINSSIEAAWDKPFVCKVKEEE